MTTGRHKAQIVLLRDRYFKLPTSLLVAVGVWSAILSTNAQVNVVQYRNHSSRDGLYIDSAFTQSAAANLMRDLNFDGTMVGSVYEQPLYIDGRNELHTHSEWLRMATTVGASW